MLKKVTILFILTLIYSFTNINPAFSENASPINILIKSKPIEFNDTVGTPYIDQNDRTLVPLRVVVENSGAQVQWDGKSNVLCCLNDKKVIVPIGEKYIIRNGVRLVNDTQAVINNGRTYLPIRVVMEYLGFNVIWKKENNTIIIKNSEYTKGPNNTLPADHVVSSEDELHDAALKGGSILINANFTIKKPVHITKYTVILGNGKTISGNGETQLIRVENSSLSINDITLINGNSTADTNDFSRQCGAAITAIAGDNNQQTSLSAINVNFINNTAPTESSTGDIRGGAVYLFNIPNSLFSNCCFINNKGSNGGAIGGLGSSVEIKDCQFVNNIATGASIHGKQLSEQKLPANGQQGSGGAISLDGVDQNGYTSYLNISNSCFSDNVGSNLGGAIFYVFHKDGDNGYKNNSLARIQNCSFEYNEIINNEASLGGAIYAQEGSLTLESSTFYNNICGSQGGGLWFQSSSGNFTAQNCTFSENILKSPQIGMGGGLALNCSKGSLTNCTIANNFASFHGGGVQTASGETITATNCIFYNNSSTRDWAMYNSNMPLVDGGGNIEFLSPSLTKDRNVKSDKTTSGSFIVNPMLKAIDYYGGTTKTMALSKDSPAINSGIAVTEFDQRGFLRVDQPDIGAYEYTGEDYNISFSVISDIHSQTQELTNAIKDLYTINNKMDLMVLNGDIVDQGLDQEYEDVQNCLESNKALLPSRIIKSIGNHEYFNYSREFNTQNDVDESKARFLNFSGEPNVYFDKWINGYHFIFLGSEKTNVKELANNSQAFISEEQQKWLSEKLLENYIPGKPVFVFLHQPLKSTVAGSIINYAAVAQDKEVHDILKKYADVILFTSHTHYPLTTVDSFIKQDFTMIETSSIYYGELPDKNGVRVQFPISQGIYVNVSGNKVIIQGRNFADKTWINDAVMRVN